MRSFIMEPFCFKGLTQKKKRTWCAIVLLSQTNFLLSLLKLVTVNFPHSLLSTGKRHISEEQSSKSFVTFGPVIMS